ncbi:MAG: Stk1 family PASTA domain-containing Ser/Thr kinase, partial [Halanaerobium sp.]
MQGKILNNRYKIIDEIGRGGMAIVYSARDTLLERRVALKMLRPEYKSDDEFIDKFRQEARAVARLSHPNVVSIYDIVVDEERIYLVMEIVEGKTLKDIIKEKNKLSIAESLEITRQIAAALSVAHSNQIVHCDIKPHNIIINSEHEVKVTDFGIARAVSSSTVRVTETVVGSAHYFSPEQAKGGEIKAYSDIYSLGVVLYEMTTGELPFHGDSPISVALKHIQQEPVEPSKINSDIPEEVNNLIMKAIAKDPAERFQDAYEMRQQITYCLKNLKSGTNKTAKKVDFNPDETRVMKKSDLNFLNNSSKNKKDDSKNKQDKKEKNNKKNKVNLKKNTENDQTAKT